MGSLVNLTLFFFLFGLPIQAKRKKGLVHETGGWVTGKKEFTIGALTDLELNACIVMKYLRFFRAEQ